MPSNAFLTTSWNTASACASRVGAEASMVCTAFASKLLLTTFWIVGMSALPVMAARQVSFSAFQFFAIEPSAIQLYQTGFDSSTLCNWIEARALWSHGGIHALLR